MDRNMPWPRAAVFEETGPKFVLKQEWGGYIEVIPYGMPSVVCAKIPPEGLKDFCKIFGLDYPEDLCDHGQAQWHADEGYWSCPTCGYGT